MFNALDSTVSKTAEMKTTMQSGSLKEKNQTDIKIPIKLVLARAGAFFKRGLCHRPEKTLCLQRFPLFLNSLVDSRDCSNSGIFVSFNHAQLTIEPA